mmetsp:Transcript_121768/g.279029  ORF Transcript_121768/g.279029 Transcript_121768/m.279029 type:complete len:697 (+) Transcript_121768:35-2125(+)
MASGEGSMRSIPDGVGHVGASDLRRLIDSITAQPRPESDGFSGQEQQPALLQPRSAFQPGSRGAGGQDRPASATGTATQLPRQLFADNEKVDYFSSTQERWICGTVKRFHPDEGTYDLDVKQGAKVRNMAKRVYDIGDRVLLHGDHIHSDRTMKVEEVLGDDHYVLSDATYPSNPPQQHHVESIRRLGQPPAADAAAVRAPSPPTAAPAPAAPAPTAKVLPTSFQDPSPSARDEAGGGSTGRMDNRLPNPEFAVASILASASSPALQPREDYKDSSSYAPAPVMVDFEIEEKVQYFSTTFDRYVPAIVVSVNEDGTVDLNVKPKAQLSRIRKQRQPDPESARGIPPSDSDASPAKNSVKVSESEGSPVAAPRVVKPLPPPATVAATAPRRASFDNGGTGNAVMVPAGNGSRARPLPAGYDVRPPPIKGRRPMSSVEGESKVRGVLSYGPLNAPPLVCDSVTYDPATSVRDLCRGLNITDADAVVKAMTGFKGGMNKGIWFLKAASRPTLVLKLVTALRPHPSAYSEAENLQRLATELPALVKDMMVTFPVKIFRINRKPQQPLYDLLVMEAAEGRTAVDVFTTLLSRRGPAELKKLWEVLHAIGAALKVLHSTYPGKQHGDVQPNNVFVDIDRMKVTFIDIGGFGLSRPVTDVQHFQNSLNLLAKASAPGGLFGPPFKDRAPGAFLAGYNGAPCPA